MIFVACSDIGPEDSYVNLYVGTDSQAAIEAIAQYRWPMYESIVEVWENGHLQAKLSRASNWLPVAV
jgi:hypothetical protein